ncbi:MAG: pyridoxamine 5'-phosphate oxidase [Bacteroidales bacterium]|jgi:pyridoxamine 5'-phosphate oxidase|nr:pyridoxamine 5'-phosphate oxidase [Bacteroidales bacterium]
MKDPYYYRNEYGKEKLSDTDLPINPIELFEKWLSQAFDADLPEPTAMTLATSDMEGRISSRIILLKGFDTGGFQFYTNYSSQKGENLECNKFAALSFFWPELERQVRIEGKVEKISSRDSDLYHSARPRNNQLGAWASEQSKPVLDRETLESQFKAVKEAYRKHKVITRPTKWGGYILTPDRVEFWQGRENRLHDRINYIQDRVGSWSHHRLNP